MISNSSGRPSSPNNSFCRFFISSCCIARPFAASSKSGAASSSHEAHFRHGHGPTDAARWATASAPYEVAFEEYYEPYIIASRAWLPNYDERFRGYGMNKVQHLRAVAAAGWLRHDADVPGAARPLGGQGPQARQAGARRPGLRGRRRQTRGSSARPSPAPG